MLTINRPITTIANNIPPQNIEVEEAILGGILLDPTAIAVVASILPSEQAFYVHAHQIIYKACLALHKKNQLTDLMTVTNYLQDKKKLDEIGGGLKLINLLNGAVSTTNIDRHAQIVAEKYLRRRLIESGHNTIDAGYDTFNDVFEVIESLHAEFSQYKSQIKKESSINEVLTMRYQKIIEEFREIELKCTDPGLRLFCIQELATKYRKSERQLESLFYKHLVNKEDEPVKYLNQLREEIGDKTNAWFLHGFIPKGTVVLIHSYGGLGKSRLAYEFALHLASGTPWGQFQVTAPRRKVMLVQTDEQTTDTLRAIGDRWPSGEIDRYIAHKSKWSTDHVAKLAQEMEQENIDVAVIDSYTTVNKHSIFSENETEYARPILMFKEIAEKTGKTIVIIHHSNSAGQSRGTKAIFNSVSLVLSLQLPSEGTSRTSPNRLLCIEKSRFQRPTNYRLRYEVDEETHQWSWVCDGEDIKEVDTDQPVKQRILDDLACHRNIPWEAREIYERIGGSYDDVRRACYRLSNDGLIERRRTLKTSHAWAYFLAWDEKPFADHRNNDQRDDQRMISDGNSNGVRISALADHPIAKNASKNSQLFLEKNNDQMISDTQNADTEQVNGADHLADHSLIIVGDDQRDITADKRQNVDIEQVNVADHLADHQDNFADHQDNFADHQDNFADHQDNFADHQTKKAKYRYCGKDWRTEQKCLMQTHLEIVEIQGKDAIVTAPDWQVLNRIPLKDLKLIRDR